MDGPIQSLVLLIQTRPLTIIPQFAQTQEHVLSLTQLVSQGLPDDDVTRRAAAHFPSDCGPGGRTDVFIRLISMGFDEQRARDAAAITSCLEEALNLM